MALVSCDSIIEAKLNEASDTRAGPSPYEPDQLYLMPASVQDWLPKGHLAYFISDVVDHLNLSAIMSRCEGEKGYPPYHPVMMLKVLL